LVAGDVFFVFFLAVGAAGEGGGEALFFVLGRGRRRDG